MIAILDNDLVKKLTKYGLLAATQTLLKRKYTEFQLQPTIDATFDLENKQGKFDKLDTPAQKSEMLKFSKQCKRVSLDDCGKKLASKIHLEEGIGPGDSIWLSAAACNSNAHLYTGDKRALRAARKSSACAEVVSKIAGRSYCLEQLIKELIASEGIAVVRRQILDNSGVDDSVEYCFADKQGKEETTSKLNSKIDALKSDTDPILG